MNDIYINEDDSRNREQMSEIKKYQGTKIIRVYRDRIEIGEQSPYEWTLFKTHGFSGREGVIVSAAEIEYGKALLNSVLLMLSDREVEVIKKRSGLENGRKISREEIAKLYGTNERRIQQIEAKSLRKLRHPDRSQILLGKTESAFRCVNNSEYLERLKKNLLNEVIKLLSKNEKEFVYFDKICSRYNIKINQPLKQIDLDKLGLSVRACICLKRAGITKSDQLLNLPDSDLKKIRNLGKKTYEEIKECIKGIDNNCATDVKSEVFCKDDSRTIILMLNNQKIIYKCMGVTDEQIANSVLTTIFNLKKSKKIIEMQMSPKIIEFLTMKGYLFWDDVYTDRFSLLEQLRICQINECVIELQELCRFQIKRKEKVLVYPGRESIRNFIIHNNYKKPEDIINNIKNTDNDEIIEFIEQLKELIIFDN